MKCIKKMEQAIKAALKLTLENEVCPWCGNDLRPQYDCRNCITDHMGDRCFRSGKHDDECEYVAIMNMLSYILLYYSIS